MTAGADVLPPWKQGDYEAVYTTVTSVTQVGQEQQVTGIREVRQGLLGEGRGYLYRHLVFNKSKEQFERLEGGTRSGRVKTFKC